jgi:hypothetical protein
MATKLVQCLTNVFTNTPLTCQRLAGAMDLLQDTLATRFPNISCWVQNPFGKIIPDGNRQFFDAAETTRKHDVLAEVAEEAFDQIEPRHAGWREMQMEAGMLCDPSEHGGVRRGSFASVPDLITAIELWNRDPKPFICQAKAEDILARIERCRRRLEQIQPGCTLPKRRKRAA